MLTLCKDPRAGLRLASEIRDLEPADMAEQQLLELAPKNS